MDFHYTVTTKKSMEEAIQSLAEKLKEKKFGILWDLDITQKLKANGVTSFQSPYRILEVCNPNEAGDVLQTDMLAGYFLPCKITVYESEGSTKIGLPKPTALISMLDRPELKDKAEDIENTLIAVLNSCK